MAEAAASGLGSELASGPESEHEYEGVGVGTAAVAGPVALMGRTPPEPPDAAADGDADAERAPAGPEFEGVGVGTAAVAGPGGTAAERLCGIR